MKIGIVVSQPAGVHDTLALAQKVEDRGFHAVWLTSGGGGDAIPMLAALAQNTTRVQLGTSVVQSLPRHPTVLAQEAHVIAQLAPGRVRLGVGPSHRPLMDALGLPFDEPLARLDEYVRILQTMFQAGRVEFTGRFYKAVAALPSPIPIPVMIGALRRNAFELAGRATDGAITWLCPGPFLRDVALPSLRAAAAAANRPAPPLIAHAAVCVDGNPDRVRAAVRATIGNIRLPFYQRMLRDAGYPEAMSGVWTDRLIDEIIIWGDSSRVRERLTELAQLGVDEILVKVVQTGDVASLDPTITAIAPLAR